MQTWILFFVFITTQQKQQIWNSVLWKDLRITSYTYIKKVVLQDTTKNLIRTRVSLKEHKTTIIKIGIKMSDMVDHV